MGLVKNDASFETHTANGMVMVWIRVCTHGVLFLLLILIFFSSTTYIRAAPLRIALSRRLISSKASENEDSTLISYTPIDTYTTQAQDFHPSRSLRTLTASTTSFPRNQTIRLKNYGNVQYIGKVAFGNPPQLLSVVFDTGSSDTWIPGTDCVECGSHTLFQVDQSTTYLDTQEQFLDAYGSGSVSGTIVMDTVTLGGYKVDSVKFGIVQSEDETLQAFIADGLFGLAFEGLAQISRPTVFSALAEANSEVQNMFAFYLTPEAYRTGSELHIGGYDLSVVGVNASFHYTPVVTLPEFDTYMYWTIQLNRFTVGLTTSNTSNNTLNFCSPYCYAIVDTGTSLISIPEGIYSTVIEMITHGLNCDGDTNCEDVDLSMFPILEFGMIPDNVFQLQPQDYIECYGWGQCQLQLQSTSDEWWILGDVFIKTYYTLFDGENMRIGFACNGEVCSGGRGEIYGGMGEENGWYRALTHAFLLGSCFAAACLFLFVFYMNQQDETNNSHGNTSKTPLLHSHHESTEYVLARPVFPSQKDTRSLPILVATTSYEEARQHNHELPSPSRTKNL